ncbi:MAG: tetratricopeptide repeat protein [Deltaproteobacteria bacterium]
MRRSLPVTCAAAFVVAVLSMSACVTSTPLLRQAASLNSRGALLLARGDLEGAEASFELALEYNGRYAEPHNNLGLVALRRERYREARRHFRAAIARNRDFAEAWSNLGVALSHADGNAPDTEATPERAAGAFREALAVNPGLVEARVNLVRALLAMGLADEALAQSRRLVQAFDGQPLPHTLRAEAALAAGLTEEAASEAGLARSIAPQDPEVQLVSARVDMFLGATGEARRVLRDLVHVPSVSQTARALLAALALAEGDAEGARRELSEGGPGMERVPAARAVLARMQPQGPGPGPVHAER